MRSIVSALLASLTTAFIYHPVPQVIRADMLEFLRHVEMVDIPTDDNGGTARAVRISGINVQIVNGQGATETVDGTGNLIIGYNELLGDGDNRSGSHNIVSGHYSNYTSYGGLVAGSSNSILGPYATVSGGNHSRASGFASSVSGGFQHEAIGTYSSVSGGVENVAIGFGSAVSGGGVNRADAQESWVGGGEHNHATGRNSTVCGGAENRAVGSDSVVGGGYDRDATGPDDWVAGTLFQDQ